MYEIIEKNQYGVLVRNTTGTEACIHCKYERGKCGEAHNYCKLNPLYYFLPDSEFTDAYNSETQKEIIDLRVELRVEKEKCKSLIRYLEESIESCKEKENHFKSIAIKRSSDVNWAMIQAYNNVLEFIKHKK